jgi:hypothetical protein
MLRYMCTACRVLITLLCVMLKLNAFYQISYSLNKFEPMHEIFLSMLITCPISSCYRASRETMTGATHTEKS